ncbi:MAG TPA: response regulator [Chthoniobacterales bacterium]
MKKRILVVDDEPNVRLSYRITLETEGFAITEAESASKALEYLAAQTFDLAILDMRMPEADGLELLSEMRNRHYLTPAVIITAYGDIPHAVQAMKLGAIDFLSKPMTPEALRNIVQDILARHEPKPEPARRVDDFETNMMLAKRLLNLQEFSAAKEYLVRALEFKTNAESFNLAGVLFEMQGDQELAKKYYGHAIKLDKNYEPAQQNMRRLFELSHFGYSCEPYNLGDQ